MIKRLGLLLAVVVFGLCLGWLLRNPLGPPSHTTFSGPIQVMAFSPDEKHVAYIWKDASYVSSAETEGRPATLTENLQIRVRPVSQNSNEIRIPLTSIDLRPNGQVYFETEASLRFSPDSRYLAAICPHRMIIIDVAARTNLNIEFPGEHFGTVSWLETNTLCYSTCSLGSIRFWHWNLSESAKTRTRIYSVNGNFGEGSLEGNLDQVQWSPNGRYACLCVSEGTNGLANMILDARTGTVRRYPFSLYYQCWKPDSSALLVNDALGDDHGIYLVDPASGETDNLSRAFKEEFRSWKDITFVAPVWETEGNYVVLYATSPESTAIQIGCLVQPKPFKVVLKSNQIIRRSPIPGWILLQGDMSFEWINYSGTIKAHIQGWPNDWIWSANGRYAAKVDKGKLEVFKPILPPGVVR